MENRYVKAKVRATGEVIVVSRPPFERKFYRKDEPAKGYDYKELEFIEDKIDYEQRRFELVKAAMQGLAIMRDWKNEQYVAESAVKYADAVLAEYKKGGER